MYRNYSKYHACKVNAPEGKFDSKKEYYRFKELQLMEFAGEITDLQRQVRFEIIESLTSPNGKKTRPTYYIADFVYKDKTGKLIVEDTKGVKTDVYKLKAKLFLKRYGFEITEV